MHLLVQSRKVDFKVLLVALPCCSIDSRSRFPLEAGVGFPQSIDRHIVEQSGEPFLLPLLCCFSYTVKPLGHAFPARCPVRVLLSRVSLGPFPWLRQLRPTLRLAPRDALRMTRGQSGLLFLHCWRLSLFTLCRSPGAQTYFIFRFVRSPQCRQR